MKKNFRIIIDIETDSIDRESINKEIDSIGIEKLLNLNDLKIQSFKVHRRFRKRIPKLDKNQLKLF